MGNDKTKLRRYEDDLNVSGLGVVILGAWSILKFLFQAMLQVKDVIGQQDFPEEEQAIAVGVTVAIVIVILLIAFLILRIHMYIGLNASKAAKGEPYKKGYYTGAVILLVFSVLGMFAYIYELKDLNNLDITIASFIVDLTLIYILWIIVSSTRKIRELKSLQVRE